MSSIKVPSEKNFGITFAVIFLLIFVYFFIVYKKLKFLLLIFSIFLFLISITKPKLLKFPNILWFKFGILLSKVMTPLILGIIFFLILGPISLLRKLFIFKERKSDTTWKNCNKNEKINFKKKF